ncbi:MAG: hypothetical protein DI536_27745 [Archangium gephyra]|uniref:HTTM-like domain-containing protein n=1 Tax=Archangium gephyra TaxID=48 RepID=A0A2W5UEW0_9BACT|nr:MAG: hypothetical protein DI536_27745 [Archangium gephyra]
MERLKASRFAQQLLTASPVTLGAGRVLLALLLLFDVLRRWEDLDVWYTNAGLMPNHTMLWAPQARLGFSIFYGVSELHEARFFVGLIVIVYLLLLVGWKTKLMQLLALAAQLSLNCRVHYLTNGGDVALSVLLVWTAFLPLGSWLSIDSLRRSMRHSKLNVDKHGVATLEGDPEVLSPPKPYFEWVMGALALQLAVIYLFNYLHKDTDGWRDGRVLLDVMHQDRIATALAEWLRPHVTPGLSMALTRFTQFVEATLPIWVLLPAKSMRRLAIVLGLALHFGFMTFLNLGVFSTTMLMFWFFMIRHDDLVWLGQKVFGAPRKDDVKVDASLGRWAAHATLAARSRAVTGLPGFVPRWFEALSRRLELDVLEPSPFSPDTALTRRRVALGGAIRNALLAFMFVVFVIQTLAQNRPVPQAIKPVPPFWVLWPVEYLHFFQGWGMFAVSPREDATVVVRARTFDGRLVDPLSERASRRSPPGINAILTRLGHDEFWCDYLSRIGNDRAYEPPLKEWILRYPDRTGNPNDRIASFDVVQITDVSPWYGETVPTNTRERVVLHYP